MRTRRLPSPVRFWARWLAAAALAAPAAAAFPGVAQARAQAPAIASVSAVSDTRAPVLVITGSGFGSAFPAIGQPADTRFLRLADTALGGWNAGYTGDWCEVTVLAWSDTRVLVQATGVGGLQSCGLSAGMGIEVTVWSTSDPSASASAGTSVVTAPAAVSGLSPFYGPTAGGTLSVNDGTGAVTPQPGGAVTITGSGFSGATQVLFGTVPAASFTVASPSQISAIPPAEQNPSPVPVVVVTPSGSSAPACPLLDPACSVYSYLSSYAFNSSVDRQIFSTSFSLAPNVADDANDALSPCEGDASGSVGVDVSADASLSGSGYVSSLGELPFAAALASSVDLRVNSLTASLSFDGSGDFTCNFPVPALSADGLGGLDLHVDGSVDGSITIPYTMSGVAGTMSGGFVGTTQVGPAASFTCQGSPVSTSSISQCASFTSPQADIDAQIQTGPWVQFGPDDLNAAAGVLVGAGASYGSPASQLSVDACVSPLHVEANASAALDGLSASFSFASDVLGAYNIYDTSASAESLCPFGTPQTPGVLPPGPPAGVTASSGNSAATVTWQPPAADNGEPPTGYVVTPYLDGAPQSPQDTGSSATSAVIGGLANGSVYTFTVAAVNAAGPGPQSPQSNAVEPAVGETAFVADAAGQTVTPIAVPADSPGSPINVGAQPFGVSSVAPDGNHVWVASAAAGNVSVIDTTSDRVVQQIPLASGGGDPVPQGVAISPDGQQAYVSDFGTNAVSVINTANYSVASTIQLGADTGPEMLALSPDGQELYVAESLADEVAVVSTVTGQVTSTIPVDPGPLDIVVSPDGTTAYVSSNGDATSCGDTVDVLNLASGMVSARIPVGSGPAGLAITPDGSQVYVSDLGMCGPSPTAGDTVSVIDTATRSATGTLTVGAGPGNPAVSPDGSAVFVPDFGNAAGQTGSTVSVISTASDSVSATIQGAGSGPAAVVFTPDQAALAAVAGAGPAARPRAAAVIRLAARSSPVAGTATVLDASASSATTSQIASYDWNFGDGASSVTTAPAATHVYQAPGRYTVTVTAVDRAGTGATQVYNGQEVMREGGGQATASASLTVESAVGPPAVSVANPAAGQTSSYVISATTSPDGALGQGASLSVVAPPGTTLPAAAGSYTVTDQSGARAGTAAVTRAKTDQSATPNMAVVTLSQASFPASDALRVAISGVGNPATAASDATLALSTSADQAPTLSAPYAIAPGAAWEDITGIAGKPPSARSGAAMAYDAAAGYTVLFGGYGCGSAMTSACADTWILKNGAWRRLPLATHPAARSQASIAYDAAAKALVLFGGLSDAGKPLSDTWVFKAGAWKRLPLPTSPPARWAAAMAYDPAVQRVVLFGGFTGSRYLADTWEFSAGAWKKLALSPAPGPRAGAGMVDDPAAERLLLFGGTSDYTSAAGARADTWAFSGGAWAKLALSRAPSARYGFGFSYDPALGAVLLYGGWHPSGSCGKVLGDTWEFAGGGWRRAPASVHPAARQGAVMAQDPRGHGDVLFGGVTGTCGTAPAYHRDTWRFGSPA